jgi:hypothetical protein
MDRLTSKMSLNPIVSYDKNTTVKDQINNLKDQAEYMGNYLLNAPAAFWNTIVDLVPGTIDLVKTAVKDPG